MGNTNEMQKRRRISETLHCDIYRMIIFGCSCGISSTLN